MYINSRYLETNTDRQNVMSNTQQNKTLSNNTKMKLVHATNSTVDTNVNCRLSALIIFLLKQLLSEKNEVKAEPIKTLLVGLQRGRSTWTPASGAGLCHTTRCLAGRSLFSRCRLHAGRSGGGHCGTALHGTAQGRVPRVCAQAARAAVEGGGV